MHRKASRSHLVVITRGDSKGRRLDPNTMHGTFVFQVRILAMGMSASFSVHAVNYHWQ